MHELSITEHLLYYCLREAQRQGAVKIRAIKICVGQLGGIVPECIQVYLDMLSEGTIRRGRTHRGGVSSGQGPLPGLRQERRDHSPAACSVRTAAASGWSFSRGKNFISKVWR